MIEGLMYGGFTADRSDPHLRNCHSFDAQSEADVDCFRTTRALVVAARRGRKLANDRLKPLKQSIARWETLYLVAYSEEELNQSQLARLIGVQGPTMIRMLDGLAREGLIERQQSRHDLRVTINRITDEGQSVISRIMGVTNALRYAILAGVDRAELRTAIKGMTQILRSIDQYDATGDTPAQTAVET